MKRGMLVRVSVEGSIENKRSRGWFQLTEASKRHTRLGIKRWLWVRDEDVGKIKCGKD
jgi:hypothetical protein